MVEERAIVIGGVDCHSRTHHAVALGGRAQRLGDAEFPATIAGYQALHAWLEEFGTTKARGIESSSSYGAGLTRWLSGRQIRVLEVNQPHKHTRSRKGKSDSVDAEAAARKVLAGETVVVPKDTAGSVESIRQLRVAREGGDGGRLRIYWAHAYLIDASYSGSRERFMSSAIRLGRVLCLQSVSSWAPILALIGYTLRQPKTWAENWPRTASTAGPIRGS